MTFAFPITYFNRTDEGHVLALDDFKVHGGWRDFRNAGEFLRLEAAYPLADHDLPRGSVAPRFDRIGNGEVLQPSVKFEKVAVTVPMVAMQRKVSEKKSKAIMKELKADTQTWSRIGYKHFSSPSFVMLI